MPTPPRGTLKVSFVTVTEPQAVNEFGDEADKVIVASKG